MNTCKTCKWWRIKDDYHEGLGICKSPKIISDENEHRITMDCICADAVGGGNYDSSQIRTGPDFGCIHHTPKE